MILRNYQKNFHKLSKSELSELMRYKLNSYDYTCYFKSITQNDIMAFINTLPDNKQYCLYDRRDGVKKGEINTKRNNESIIHKDLLSFEFVKVRTRTRKNYIYYNKASIHVYSITEFPTQEDIVNVKMLVSSNESRTFRLF